MDSANILMQKGERLTFFLKHPIKFSVIKLKKKHMLNNFETKDIKKIKKTSKSTLSKHPSSGFKPGDIAPMSGQYKNTTTGTEVTSVKGEPLPPTQRRGQRYVLIDKTKHKKR